MNVLISALGLNQAAQCHQHKVKNYPFVNPLCHCGFRELEMAAFRFRNFLFTYPNATKTFWQKSRNQFVLKKIRCFIISVQRKVQSENAWTGIYFRISHQQRRYLPTISFVSTFRTHRILRRVDVTAVHSKKELLFCCKTYWANTTVNGLFCRQRKEELFACKGSCLMKKTCASVNKVYFLIVSNAFRSS